ncbi:hypothetical protein CC86DRAFT_373672 [Ophiobolus disseminans]|uniref:Uncharacterized protein n=1 Tax=Ophiobolus disseminans TaxID=1469910 RepID=A0A6A6ZM37_9PLEO|nr:hypothetical protein CC86DRAFT_373672 [Ophiobolus disseminans]
MFARLSTGGPSTPSSTKVAAPSSGPAASEFSFEDRPAMKDVGPTQVVESKATSSSAPSAKGKEPVSAVVSTSQEKEFKKVEHTKDISQKDLEQLYLRKAAEYLGALPSVNDVSVQLIKTVTNKLRNTYTPDAKLSTDEAEILKNRYVFAIVNYINQVLKKTATPIKAEDVKKALQDCDGNILALYGALVGKSHLAIDDIEGITDLFKMIQDVLPNAEPITAPTISQVKPTATAAEFNPASKDPMDKLKAWPTQEKREDPAQHRACILKGVSGVKSINELQALVWGGRLESIAMPPPGSGFAVVRFLTPEACEKFFKATENGIEVQGDLKKAVVFVEKQPGPSSINDVMRNCIEGDASRCVRALDAEEDWSDILLMKLARGKGVGKREVDRIKRGKTARGRYYIEFRFANIYHALNFKKMLMDDPDWETCTISYAADPCESANGVHYKDEDD